MDLEVDRPNANACNNNLDQVLSDENLAALNTANNPYKRKSDEPQPGTSTTDLKNDRSEYAKEAKAHYLRLKTLHKKKLVLALSIQDYNRAIEKKIWPYEIDFKLNPPSRLFDQKVRDKFSDEVRDFKVRLSTIILEDLKAQYRALSPTIEEAKHKLSENLNEGQYKEIIDSLNKGFSLAARRKIDIKKYAHARRIASSAKKERPKKPAKDNKQGGGRQKPPQRTFQRGARQRNNPSGNNLMSVLRLLLNNIQD